jgi:hypothetical protein
VRTIVTETQVFSFAELSESAKQTALAAVAQDSQSCWVDHSSREYLDSLKKWAEFFNVTIRDYCLGDDCSVTIRLDRLDDCYIHTQNVLAMQGVRLWKWIMNGHAPFNAQQILQAANGSCPLTGVHSDCPLFDPLADFLKKPDSSTTWEELLRACVQSFVKAAQSDYDWRGSDECCLEEIQERNLEFTADGHIHW